MTYIDTRYRTKRAWGSHQSHLTRVRDTYIDVRNYNLIETYLCVAYEDIFVVVMSGIWELEEFSAKIL